MFFNPKIIAILMVIQEQRETRTSFEEYRLSNIINVGYSIPRTFSAGELRSRHPAPT